MKAMIEYWTELYRHPQDHWIEILILVVAFGVGTLIAEYMLYKFRRKP